MDDRFTPAGAGPDLASLRTQLGDRLVTDTDAVARYTRDSSRDEPEGTALAVVEARSTADVVAALAWANERGVRVSVRGAGTGLAGGANAYADGLIVSLASMNRIIDVNADERLAVVQPGVVTAELDAAARLEGLFYPPDPASARSCTIGGNIATNAGGLRCVAHGVTRDAVAALEVVLADGRVLRTGSRTRKNVVGYDLTSLIVGSEGTLGIVTEATLRLKPVPPGTPCSFRASFDSFEAAGRAVTAIMGGMHSPEVLELMDAASVEIIEAYQPSGITVPRGAMLVGQTVGSNAAAEAAAITDVCRVHGATETELSDSDAFIEARRLSNPALTARGLKLSCDVGVPVNCLAEMFHGITQISRRHDRLVSTVAHAGDGNLHSTVDCADDDVAAADAVLDEITRLALSLDGTITGEHGVGSVKLHELPWQLNDVSRDVHATIKRALDPRGTLTPGRAI